MAVQPQTPYKEYTANGSTKSFALEFDCDNQDHLIVLVDDIEPVVGVWSLIGGAVVFGTAPGNGKKITIQRNTPFRRDGDFQSYDNSFRPGPVNKGFDWVWLKLQELGVADWILSNRINDLRAYVDKQDNVLQDNIDSLKNYVDDKDDELRNYLLNAIQEQGVALDQLEEYYSYLMQQLAQVAIDRGWAASFIVSADGSTQQEINDFGGAEWWNKPGGYKLGATVKLENGDIVQSTIANNTNNPNSNMTGWINSSLLKYLNIVDNWGANGDGVTQNKVRIQAAIDNLHAAWVATGKEQTLLFMPDRKYVCDGITFKAGVHWDVFGGGKATLLKTPATAGQTEASLNWRRIVSSDSNMSTLGNKIRHRINNIILDGNLQNMNWTFGSYNQEQGMSLILTTTKGGTIEDRAKFELNNVDVINSVSDGICINTNIDVILNNCSGNYNFRGGVVPVGGNSNIVINNWSGENANIHIEVDSGGFDGHVFKTNVTVNGGEVDRVLGKSAIWGGTTAHVRGGANVIYNNFKCYSGGLDIFACDTNQDNKIIFNDCFLSWNGGLAYSIPKLLQFNNSTFVSDFRGKTSVQHGWLPYWFTYAVNEAIGAEIIINGGSAKGLYDSDALKGAFIQLNTGGVTSDPSTNPIKMIRFIGGFSIEGYNYPCTTQYGGMSVEYDDAVINTLRFLNLSAGTGAVGGLHVELGKLKFGKDNIRTYYSVGKPSYAKIWFRNTIIPLAKFQAVEDPGVQTEWDCLGQLTLEATETSEFNAATFKAFAGTRVIFTNAVKGGVMEYVAYPSTLVGTKSLLTSRWSATKLANNAIISTTATYDPPSLTASGTAGDSVTTTVTLTGAVIGNNVNVAFSQYNVGVEISAQVSAANTVTVKFKNTSAAAVDLASGTLTVKLI